MIKNRQAVIHYSGGTDSTCVVCLKANEFEKIHLISYKRFGIFQTQNIETNVEKLNKMFGKDKFVRKILDINKLYKFVVYNDYFYNLKKFGFFNLAVGGLCKMAMHTRTILYCLENNIDTVFDGANKFAGNKLATDQIKEYIDVINNLYSQFNISYSAPVYDMAAPQHITWQLKLGMDKEKDNNGEITTGMLLKKLGFFNSDNLKGTKQDKNMQARCFQQFLSNIALNYYYIEENGEEKYRQRIKEFFTNKSIKISEYIKLYLSDKKNSKLSKYIL